jgi:hypothetical protein
MKQALKERARQRRKQRAVDERARNDAELRARVHPAEPASRKSQR